MASSESLMAIAKLIGEKTGFFEGGERGSTILLDSPGPRYKIVRKIDRKIAGHRLLKIDKRLYLQGEWRQCRGVEGAGTMVAIVFA
jgi:hypothetical protein